MYTVRLIVDLSFELQDHIQFHSIYYAQNSSISQAKKE